jgi:adenine-specific DNA-methyltransferase
VGDALASDWPCTFDALVANPPYIRQELVANKARLRGFEVYDGVADLYVYFVELAHRIARRFCIVVPNKWMTAAYGRPLREYLARRRSLEGLVDFEAGLFSDADAFPCILWGTSAGATTPLRAGRAKPPVADALASGHEHDRTRWQSEPWHIDSPDDAEVLERLRDLPTLGSLVGQPSRGVVTGCNRAFVITREQRDALDSELVRPFIKGRDIRRWRPADVDRYLLLIDRGTELTPAIRKYLAGFRDALEPKPAGHRGAWAGRKPGSYKWYELQDPVVPLAKSRTPRLFYQDIQSAPAACLDLTGELVPDTTVWILPTADRFLLALLNSKFYAWYARRRFPPALNGAVRPKLEYMRALPIAQPRPPLRAKISTLVDEQLAGANHDAEIDRLIDEAYGLRR